MPSAAIPVNVIFSPSWWFRHFSISFREPFYLDLEERIRNDVLMRKALYERFGLGQPDPQPRPIIGSRHIAGGFVVPALLGVPVRFSDDQAAWAVAQSLDRSAVLALRVPDIRRTWPLSVLLPQMDELERRYGFVMGDLNPGGLLNTALELRGQQFFIDLVEDPEATDHLLGVVAETQRQVCELIRSRTGGCGVSTNRSIVDVDASICLTSNCSAHMISPVLYERRVLSFDRHLAERLRPFGVHHCGSNLHKYARVYAGLGACFFDVGWGSDVAQCSRDLPDAFLNLRMDPVRMLQSTADQVYDDVLRLLQAAGRRAPVGVCCINMDQATPDENVRAMFQAARDFEAAS